MLPERYRRSLRRLQIFTIAQQIRKVSELKQELSDLDKLNAEW